MALKDIINDTISEYLRDPLAFPEEFRSWVPEWTETVGIITPRSAVTGLYTTADSIGDLGEPAHGRPCMLRLGSAAPYDFVQMTFDEIANLWVSTQVWTGFAVSNSVTTVGTSYADAAGNDWTPFHVPSLANAVAAGLDAQVYVAGRATLVGASEVGYLRAMVYEYDSTDTALSAVGDAGEISNAAGTNNQYLASGWQTITWDTTPTKDNGYVIPQTKHDVGAVTWTNVNVAYRWVADPA